MFRFRSAAALLGATLWWAPLGLAQDTPKDDALDSLLEKVEQATKDDAQPNEPKAPDAKPDDAQPNEPKPPEPKPDEVKPDEVKAAEKLTPKDEALDDLLKGLGETKETPAPDEKPKKPGAGGDPADGPPPPQPGEPKPDALKPEDKSTDEHLEELTGRKHRKKNQKQDGDGQGPLVETVKKMREVEKRLGEPDTGETTRDKQKQIVKDLDKILEQVRIIQIKGKPDPRARMVGQQGKQPGKGSQPGSNPGTGQQGVVPPKVASKEVKKGPLVNGKDEWGHLPPDLRGEMGNVAAEKPLSAKEDLIRLYYLSVKLKSQGREE